MNEKNEAVRLIKKYPNRRLYDTYSSNYVTTKYIQQLVISDQNVQVIDSKTGKDLTNSIFIQIINELEENSRHKIFSSNFLAQIIKSYKSEMKSTFHVCFKKALDLYTNMESIKYKKNDITSPPDYLNIVVHKNNINKWKNSWKNLKGKK